MNREAALILALGTLAVAAVMVSIGSFLLLWAERRDRRVAGSRGTPGADRPEAAPPPAPKS